MKCKAKREMQDPIAMFNAKGSPVTVGVCAVCGTKLYRMGRTEAHAGLTPPEKPAKVEKRDGKLVIVDAGDVLMVCQIDQAQKVKDVVEHLKRHHQEKYL